MKAVLCAVAVVGVLSGGPAQAQFSKPEDALKYRQSVMFLQAQHMGRISGLLKADKPNLQAVADNAAILDTVNKLAFTAFPANSEGIGNSRALPAVWKEADKFKQGADKLNTNVAKMLAAAKANDLAATRAGFEDTRQTCGGCHDMYRRE